MKINIYNESTLKISKEHIKKQIKTILKVEEINCDEVSIYFVGKKKISWLHKKYFQDPSPTDCISFSIDFPQEKEGYCFLGEVFICSQIAKEYAKRWKKDPYDEATLYLIHGMLHLIGYKDLKEEDRRVMRKKEKSYIKLLKQWRYGLCENHSKRWKLLDD